MNIAELFEHYGTDKGVAGYTALYHTLLQNRRLSISNVLEIGIGTMIPQVHSSMADFALTGYKPGGSLRVWRDYFPNATIYGIDVQPDTQFSEERIKTFLCDSTDHNSVQRLLQKWGAVVFDLMIDDGSHIDTNQLKTLENFYPRLKSGGLYVLEDIHPESVLFSNPQMIATLINNDPHFFTGLQNKACVIYKSSFDSSFPR